MIYIREQEANRENMSSSTGSDFLIITGDREGLIVNSKIYLVKNPEL